jgi:hypothetical protein
MVPGQTWGLEPQKGIGDPVKIQMRNSPEKLALILAQNRDCIHDEYVRVSHS